MSPACLDSYSGDARRYDELLDRAGQVREHWQPMIERLTADWPETARRGVELARRLIVENGVTYNVYADPQGRDRPWLLDPLPLMLTEAEWHDIEQGVAQRAAVLNALLGDLYGPQHLLAEGIVPAELPFGHPNFLWPCHGVTPPGGRWLHVYAVDLARAPDGRWWVLSDRTQTPSGAGYALENRQIVTRVFPDLIREMGVRPVSRFFGALREQMLGFADENEVPLAVVLTPGTFNETYFEHAYLARQLGFPLVEGHDLTVRNDTVYLKTLGGLRRVHAILRRLDDDFCDPVELRGDSALGVPGLLGAMRAGRVLLANALGSGVLESAAWLGFLPGAAQWLHNEPLRLPSVATWWCGERPALEYVLTNIDRLVVKPAFPNQRFEPVFGRDLNARARAELAARMRARPYAYVAQERFALSQVPVWRASGAPSLSAKAVVIRVYAVADGDGYRVMPGGLARIASDAMVEVVSNQRGGGSKDIWVLSPRGGVDEITSRGNAPRMSARHDELPSRLGENLFWLGRYVERCENKAHLLRATLGVRIDAQLWDSALQSCRHFGVVNGGDDPLEDLFDTDNPLGVTADVKRLAWCASQVRGRLSTEHWRAVGVLQRQLQDATDRTDPRETLDRLLLSLAALTGFALDDMAQDDGWHLMVLGRRLERVQFLGGLIAHRLRAGLAPSQSEIEWLLDIFGSTMAYRTRYLSSPRLALTMDLLIRDTSNPRALAFQHQVIRRELQHLSAWFIGDAAEDIMEQPLAALIETDFGVLEGEGQGAAYARQSFAGRLDRVAHTAARLSDRLSMRLFSHVDYEQQTVVT